MNKLFEPIKIGSMTLKNRIVMAPMGTTTDTTNAFNMRDVKYYGERAKGGCGLVLTGAVVASTEFEPAPCQKLTNTDHVGERDLRRAFRGRTLCQRLCEPGVKRQPFRRRAQEDRDCYDPRQSDETVCV